MSTTPLPVFDFLLPPSLPRLAFRFFFQRAVLLFGSLQAPFSSPYTNLDFSNSRLDELVADVETIVSFSISPRPAPPFLRSLRHRLGAFETTSQRFTIPLFNINDAMAGKVTTRQTSRQQESGIEKRTLAFSSSRFTLCGQQTTTGFSANTSNTRKEGYSNASFTTRRSLWMLRSLLVLVLLVPCVSALPSGVSRAGRSAGMEPVAARDVFGVRHSHQPPQGRGVGDDELPASIGSGYLDRGGDTRQQRQGGVSKSIVGKSRVRRKDDVFPTVVAVNTTSAVSSGDSNRTLTIVFEQANGTESNMTVAAPPTKRWGQTATYLPTHNVVLVVGGQTSLSGDITNDVYALDVADLSAASLTSNSTAQSWQRLSSEGLPAHAYAAASAVVDPTDKTEKLWIVGGVTANCAVDAPAYVWSAPVGNITAGTWSAVYSDSGVSPTRRRGAKAVTLASANSTSIMVSGGSYDATTCAQTNGTYRGVDMWTPSSISLPASASNSAIETAHVGIDMTGTAYATIESLALDPRMRDFSVTDYTTVVLPANGTCGEKVLFLGGKDQSGSMAPMSKFWALDVATGDWEHWNATGLIPSGRMGHTAVVTPDGKVILHGGYLQDPSMYMNNNDPISEVFILDPRQSPARWEAAVWTSESSRPPALAYHSAVMADQIMMVSFGQVSDGPAASFAGQSFLSTSGGASSPVHYMDTSTMQNAGGLTWSTSTAGIAQARQAVAASVAAGAAATQQEQEPQQAPVAPSMPVTASPSVEATPNVAAPTASASASDVNATPSPNSEKSRTNQPPASNHTGAIAGSLLGAAAIAAAIGGIYAYRKRKEATAYNMGRLDAGRSTIDPNLPGDEEKFAPTRGPYVSNLYLQPDEMQDVPLAAGAASGWSARLKRAASSLTKPTAAQDRHTSAAKPVVVMRNAAPRSTAVKDSELPDDFITSLVDDESPFDRSLGRGDLVLPTPHNDSAAETKVALHHNNASRASLATVSSIGSGSAAAASHFSYPYLSGMHREASPNALSPAEVNGVQRVRVILGSPESGYDQAYPFTMSPGDVISPFHLPKNPNASPESLFLDFHKDEDDLDTNVAVDGISIAPPADVARTPLFPWSTPVIAAPPPAKIGAGRGVSMLRAKPTSLRVTNDC